MRLSNIRLISIVAIILLQHTNLAYAHSLGGYVMASIVTIVLAAVIAAHLKYEMVRRYFDINTNIRKSAFYRFSLLEIVFILVALLIARALPGNDALDTLIWGSVIYLTLGVVPNRLLLKRACDETDSIVFSRIGIKYFALSGIPLALMFALVVAIFVPLYILFGG